MKPTLNDFWARFDYEHFDRNTSEITTIIPNSPYYEEFGTGYYSVPDAPGRQTWLILQNIKNKDIWAVAVYTADSWDDSEYSERYIRGPFKVQANPRVVTVYDYEEING